MFVHLNIEHKQKRVNDFACIVWSQQRDRLNCDSFLPPKQWLWSITLFNNSKKLRLFNICMYLSLNKKSKLNEINGREWKMNDGKRGEGTHIIERRKKYEDFFYYTNKKQCTNDCCWKALLLGAVCTWLKLGYGSAIIRLLNISFVSEWMKLIVLIFLIFVVKFK